MVATALTNLSETLAEENVRLILIDGATYTSKLSRVETVQITDNGENVDGSGTAVTLFATHSGRTITFGTNSVNSALEGVATAYVQIKGRL